MQDRMSQLHSSTALADERLRDALMNTFGLSPNPRRIDAY